MDYYKNLAKYLGDDVVMVIVYLDKKKYLEEFKDDKLYEEIKKSSQNLCLLRQEYLCMIGIG